MSGRPAAPLAALRRGSRHCGASRCTCNGSRNTAARLAAVATPPAARRRASPPLQRLPPHRGAPRRCCNASRHTAARLAAVATPPAARRRLSPACVVSRRRGAETGRTSRRSSRRLLTAPPYRDNVSRTELAARGQLHYYNSVFFTMLCGQESVNDNPLRG